MAGPNRYSRRSGYVCPGCGKPVNPRKTHRAATGRKTIVPTPTLCADCAAKAPVPKRKLSYREEADAIAARLAAKRGEPPP